jgi:hypothetical protein
MELVTQPPGSTLCGQACVAMVAGVSLKQSCQAFGHKNATTLYAVRRSLKKLGFQSAEKCQAFGKNPARLPETCLLMLTYQQAFGGLGHWVAFHAGQVYDPAGSIYPFALLLSQAKSISYLAITPK